MTLAIATNLSSKPKSLTENGLGISPSYNGRMSLKDLSVIQKRHDKYVQLERETGVPWKVIAALDSAVTDFVSPQKLAKSIQENCEKIGYTFPEKFDENDAAALLEKFKNQIPENQLRYFQEGVQNLRDINSAFPEK